MTSSPASITIRRATDGDARALDRLARLDSQRVPAGPHLLALEDDVVVGAIALPSGRIVANPFATTGATLDLLRERAGHLADTPTPSRPAHALSLVRGLFPTSARRPYPRASRSS